MPSPGGVEFRGKTVEDAIQAGLAALGLKREQVEIEVLSKGSRGLLGFGAEDARVRLTPVAEKKKPPAAAAPTPARVPARPAARPAERKLAGKPGPKAAPAVRPEPPQAKPVVTPVSKVTAPASERSTEPDVAQVATELLQGMLDRMGVHASVRVVEHQGVLDVGQEPPLVLNIEGEDLGILIGRRGETLAAIQFLTRLMVNHRLRRWTNLVVDVEGYKARREQQLQRLAHRMAERVVETGRAVALEAMPARERRIIHITLRDHPHVTTQSVGEGEHRKVTIIPKK